MNLIFNSILSLRKSIIKIFGDPKISHLHELRKYDWQKRHTPNLSGTDSAYKPNKISKKNIIKNYETWKN